MGIFSKRNALFGWASWAVAKRVLKRKRKKAKVAVPAPVAGVAAKATNRKAIAGLIAAAVGLATFRRARSGGGGGDSPDDKK